MEQPKEQIERARQSLEYHLKEAVKLQAEIDSLKDDGTEAADAGDMLVAMMRDALMMERR